MSAIVGIGANVCDTLISVPCFPAEDTKMRASGILRCGGGPCATGLVAAAKLGEGCAYIGALSDDAEGQFLLADLGKYGVSTRHTRIEHGYHAFASYVLLSEKTASRTCVFDRGNVPPLELEEAQKQAIKDAKLLMVDGNELSAAVAGAKIARQSGTKVLYDAGGLYPGVKALLQYTDILIPSEEFALAHTGAPTAQKAAVELYRLYAPQVVVVTCGKRGGVLYNGREIWEYPAFAVDAVDTNGAGDVFHGAFAFAVTKGFSYRQACIFSSAVSALKCTKIGARSAVPAYSETVKFLKERGNFEFEENMD